MQSSYIFGKITSVVEMLREFESSLFPLYLQIEELKIKRRRLEDEIEFERIHECLSCVSVTSLIMEMRQVNKQLNEKYQLIKKIEADAKELEEASRRFCCKVNFLKSKSVNYSSRKKFREKDETVMTSAEVIETAAKTSSSDLDCAVTLIEENE